MFTSHKQAISAQVLGMMHGGQCGLTCANFMPWISVGFLTALAKHKGVYGIADL